MLLDEIQIKPSPVDSLGSSRRLLKSRVGRSESTSSMGLSSPFPGKGSVKDQILKLEEKMENQAELIEKGASERMDMKADLEHMMQRMRLEMEQEQEIQRKEMQVKLDTANQEIERLSNKLVVQKGHVTALQEQCTSMHKRLNGIDEEVQELVNEVVGEG